MREVIVTVSTGATGSTPVVLDQYLTPFQVSYYSTGSGTVQVTTTDPYPVVNQDFTTASFSWITAPTGSPNGANFLGQPFRAIRLSGATGGDSLTVIQSGVK